jgi:antitoxin component YwqK of YwqJK toxin-antitoxin module
MTELVKGYYPTGELMYEVFKINGKKNGEEKWYDYKSGQLREIIPYVDGKINGIYKYYYKNGRLKEIITFMDDKKNGEYKLYYEDGQLNMICYYVDDELELRY